MKPQLLIKNQYKILIHQIAHLWLDIRAGRNLSDHRECTVGRGRLLVQKRFCTCGYLNGGKTFEQELERLKWRDS